MSTMPDDKAKQIGAVITFTKGMTEQEVRNALIKFSNQLSRSNGNRIETLQTGSFDPAWGSPVFYVP